MKTLITSAALAMLLGTSAFANGNTTNTSGATSGSLSTSSSGVIVEGSVIPKNAPGMGGIGGNSTAPCVVANGFGVSGPGAGVQWSGGRIDGGCEARVETEFVVNLVNMRNGPAKQAAIRHACANDKSVQDTLVAMGLCKVAKARKSSAARQDRDTHPER